MILLSQSDRMVDRIYHEYSSQKVSCDFFVFCVALYQFIGNANDTRFSDRILIFRIALCLHTGQWQKRCTAISVLFQISDHFFCSCFIFCYNILNTATQCRLNRCLVLFFYLNQIRYNTQNSFVTAFLFHNPANTVSISVITLRNIPQRIQSGLILVKCSLFFFEFSGILF